MLLRRGAQHIGHTGGLYLLLKSENMNQRHLERPLASVDALDRVWLAWRVVVHVLVAVLCVVLLVNDGLSWQLFAFAAVYVAGRFLPIKWLWVLCVVVLWTLLLVIAPTGAFLAFALFFVAINTLQPKPALLAVLGMTAIAVYGLGRHNGWQIGGVIGPIIGALIACALGFGFLQLRREAFARAATSRHAGEVEERARLAGEIHDTVAQGLSSIQMLLHAIEQREAAKDHPDPLTLEQVALARRTAKENLVETRRIIAALQPGPLLGADLPVAIARVVTSTPLGNAFSFSTDGHVRPLPPEIDATLVRVAQSLVSNVVRHSQATRARVTLTFEPEHVSLDVVDDGVGFDPQQVPSHAGRTLGLDGVATRVETHGGTVTVESAPGEGTGVSVRIPTSTEE